MSDLFSLKPEKYYDIPKTINEEERRMEILKRIDSNIYFASIKKDGHYNRFVKDNGIIKCQSRTISRITQDYVDKSESIPHIVKDLINLPDGTIVIGELYYKNGNSAKVNEILLCSPPKAIERQQGEYGYLTYYIFDIWYYNGESLLNTPFFQRVNLINEKIRPLFENAQFIEVAEFVEGSVKIKEMLEQAFINNEEGVVLVRGDARVEPGKRTAWKTLKVKRELENSIDCFFTGVWKSGAKFYTGKDVENWNYWINDKTNKKLYGDYFKEFNAGATLFPITKNYYYDYPGSLEIGVLTDEGTVYVLGYVSGISDEIKIDFSKGLIKPFTPIEVTAMEFTEDKHLRHPVFKRFRPDINREDCLYSKLF